MQVMNFGAEVRTMTSREIAELTGKRHDHVMTDIRKMLSELGLDAPEFSGTYRTDRNAPDMTRNLDDDETGTHILRIRSENGVEQYLLIPLIWISGLNAFVRPRHPDYL